MAGWSSSETPRLRGTAQEHAWRATRSSPHSQLAPIPLCAPWFAGRSPWQDRYKSLDDKSLVVVGSGCAVVKKSRSSCVQSTGYGDRTDYFNNEACTITTPPAIRISVTSFAVEPDPSCAYDYLTVNGVKYCGSDSPDGVVTDGSSPIVWRTDSSSTMAGWELCLPLGPMQVTPIL